MSSSATATPSSGDARLPGTGRQIGRAESYGAHEGFDVLRGRSLRRLREHVRHHIAVQRVAEHGAHEHRDRGLGVGVGIGEPLLTEMLDEQYERMAGGVWALASGARRVGTLL